MNKIFYHHNNCDGGYGFPYGRPGCDGHKHDDCCDNVPKSPLPPPIPPVRYIPGVNVQEQMCHMAERVNTCIHRWNEIQCECYKALDEVVGAAVSNSVYYSPKEVRYVEGYDEETGCAYELVVISKQDKAGRPIHMRLAPAYFNVTNSGAVQRITDASFVTSAQAMISAVPYDTARWEGPMMCGGKPGSGIVNRNIYVAGWTQSGALRFFMGDATTEQLCRNKIVDAMGPVYPCVNDGEDYKEGYQSLPNRAGSVQAIGYRNCDGAKIMFSCGVQEEVGMAPVDVARVLVSMGVTTAVITSHKLPYDQEEQEGAGMNESGKAGTDKTGPDYRAVGNDGEIQLTNNAGMVFLGKQTDAPLMYKVPQGVGFWFVSKKPMPGYKNDFETEVADSIQRMGNMSSDVQNVIGGIGDTDLSGLVDDVAGLEEAVTKLDGQVTAIQSQIDEVKASVQTLEEALADEVGARAQGDATNKAAIEAEAATRAAEDQKLQAAIEAESRARETGDDTVRELVTQEQAARQAADAALSTRIDNLATGQGIATATKTRLGVVKIGDNITVKADGTISADAGLSLAEGNGIKLTQAGKVTTVSADTAVLGTKDEVTALQEADSEIEARVDGIDMEINRLDTAVQGKVSKAGDEMTGSLKTPALVTDLVQVPVVTRDGKPVLNLDSEQGGVDVIVSGVDLPEKPDDAANKQYVDNTKKDITDAIAAGSGLPIASTETLGIVRVGANLSISEDGTLSANSGGTGEGNTVTGGTGISVQTDEETKVATVSLNQTTQASLALIPNKADKANVDLKADKATVAALQSEVTANKAITDSNTQNIDSLTTTVTGHTDDIEQFRTDLANVDDVATGAMNAAADAEAKAVSAEEQATTAKAAADSAKASADAATEAVGGKVNRSGDTMTGNLGVPAIVTGQSLNGAAGFPLIFNNPSESSVSRVQIYAKYQSVPGSADAVEHIGIRPQGIPGIGGSDMTTNMTRLGGVQDPQFGHDAVNLNFVRMMPRVETYQLLTANHDNFSFSDEPVLIAATMQDLVYQPLFISPIAQFSETTDYYVYGNDGTTASLKIRYTKSTHNVKVLNYGSSRLIIPLVAFILPRV